ncbi:MAG: tRNA lysidine(34) synthetase TilS [Bacteroidales bacterium]|jgi:tRNA(Ile)-lysidine synthase|nr:tRNA lysidine(34) synthetase TilS [Bacteroidales bacterium]
MLVRFQEYARQHRLFSSSSRILLAVSGGIDSMVMAWLFRESGTDHAIAHCNFSLRKEESDRDEEFVASWAASNNIPFHSTRFDTLSYAATRKISVQMAARELRYDWFNSLIRSEGFDSVAVAHNLNDNAETFLINLIRGTGLSGLTGMKQYTGDVIRPLLFASRSEIAALAAEKNIEYREDSSNTQLKYTRNRIRHKIIPEMEKVNPGLLSSITETIDHLSSSQEIVDTSVSLLSSDLFRLKGDSAEADIEKLTALNPFVPYMFEIFRRYGLSPKQTTEVIALLGSETGRYMYTTTHRLLNDRGKIIITPRESEAQAEQSFNSIDEMRISGLFSELRISEPSDEALPASQLTASLDLDLVSFPVTVRHWEPGDRFMPLGMKKMKKISDFLIDLKVPVSEKEKVLLLLSGGEVMWIMGYRIDDRFRITDRTSKILVITV